MIRRIVTAGAVATALATSPAVARAQPAAGAEEPTRAAPAPRPSALRAVGPPSAAPRPRHTLTPPKVIGDATVPYPDGATGDATVILDVTISKEGVVTDAVPAEANEPFGSAAAEAVKTWRYEPGLYDGRAVNAKIRVEVVFHPPVVAPEDEGAAAGTGASAGAGAATAGTSGADAPKAAPAKPAEVEEVQVHGARADASRTVSLSRSEVRQIPGTFGDPFRALEIMPGVTPIVSGLPFFFVRGAPPGNVGYFLDGVRVPLLFHVGVGPSVIHPALIDHVDLYPGGYPAQFGRYAGGIVDGETVAPRNELHGEYNVRLFDAGALVETGFDHGKGTVLLGGRYSYTAALLSLFSPSTELNYWDYQARATYDVTPDDRLGVFAFGSYDFLGQKVADGSTLTVFGTQFHRVDLRWDRHLGAEGTMRVGVTLGEDLSEVDQDRSVRDRLLGARTEWSYRLGKRATVRAGTDLQLDSYDVEADSSTLPPAYQGLANLYPTRTDIAFGTRGDVVLEPIDRLEVTPGVRFDLYGSEGATALGIDPRLSTRLTVSKRVKLLTALGIAHQPPAFVVPVPGFVPGGIVGGLQAAYQESTGVEVDLGQQTIATATVFHNAFYDMSDPLGSSPPQPEGCVPGTFPTESIAGDRGDQPTGARGRCGQPRFTPGTIGPDGSRGGPDTANTADTQQNAAQFSVRTRGSAYGVELMLKRKLTARIGGFLSYTLSRSIRIANNQEYVAAFDRTHVFNGAVAYDLGRNWRAGTRVTFYTGLPKAPDPTSTDTRLPPFFRLDLRLEKRWQLGRTSWISFVAEWMNATLSKEAVSTTCTLQGCNEQYIGPITIPSLGVEGGF